MEEKQTEKIRICNIDRTPKCWQVHTDEPSDRSEDRDHL